MFIINVYWTRGKSIFLLLLPWNCLFDEFISDMPVSFQPIFSAHVWALFGTIVDFFFAIRKASKANPDKIRHVRRKQQLCLDFERCQQIQIFDSLIINAFWILWCCSIGTLWITNFNWIYWKSIIYYLYCSLPNIASLIRL